LALVALATALVVLVDTCFIIFCIKKGTLNVGGI
jgi:hypothetical protein